MKVKGRDCFTILLNRKGTHQRIQLFFGSMVDLDALALMDLYMNMVNIHLIKFPFLIYLFYA
jgi:hypothetical protein